MESEPPLVSTDVSDLVHDAYETRLPFRRTLYVIMGHWILQAIICGIAQFDRVNFNEWCVILISMITLMHGLIITCFAGLLFRTKFLISWPIVVVLLSFGISLLLCYQSIDGTVGGLLGPDFGIIVFHVYFIAYGCISSFFLWPIFRWNCEIMRPTQADQEKISSDNHHRKFQFSLLWMFYVTALFGLGSLLVAVVRDSPSLQDYFLGLTSLFFFIYELIWLLVIYLSFQLKVHGKIIAFLIATIFVVHAVIAIIYDRSRGVFEAFTEPLMMLGMSLYLVASCFLLRWAGWRIVPYAGHNKSLYKWLAKAIWKNRSPQVAADLNKKPELD